MNPRTRGLKVAVLAAGFSSRLGQSKALARINGISLLRRTLLRIRAAMPAEILVVVARQEARSRFEARGSGAKFVRNLHPHCGLSGSVRLAVRRARYSAALLLLPVDLAHLSTRDLKRLVAGWRSNSHRIAAADVPPRGGTPLVLPKRYFHHVAELMGDVGVRAILSKLPPESITLVPMRSAHNDIDTRTHLSAARRDFRNLQP